MALVDLTCKRRLRIAVIILAAVAALLAAWPAKKMQRLQIPAAAPGSVAAQAQQTVPPPLVAGAEQAVGGLSAPLAATTAGSVAVYVCGAVRKPGVYHLLASKRVIDAIGAAGGPLPDADLEQLNLAQPLTDALKVQLPAKVRMPPQGAAGGAYATAPHHRRAGARGDAQARAVGHKLQAGQTLDINAATADELVKLPGVGPALARRIVAYRTENGPFQTIDDLQSVSGIGASKFAKMENYLRL
jgi:competence protein ComEA